MLASATPAEVQTAFALAVINDRTAATRVALDAGADGNGSCPCARIAKRSIRRRSRQRRTARVAGGAGGTPRCTRHLVERDAAPVGGARASAGRNCISRQNRQLAGRSEVALPGLERTRGRGGSGYVHALAVRARIARGSPPGTRCSYCWQCRSSGRSWRPGGVRKSRTRRRVRLGSRVGTPAISRYGAGGVLFACSSSITISRQPRPPSWHRPGGTSPRRARGRRLSFVD